MSGPREGESFGAWMIDRVQERTGAASIFAGDDNRQRHIRLCFDQVAGDLVSWVIREMKQRQAATPTEGEKP